MFKNHSNRFVAASLGLLVASPVLALDARSAAVGGSAIANGYGVHGARDNPSSLMHMHRQQQRFHLHLGASVDIQDNTGLIDTAIEEDTLLTDLEREIDLISGRELSCDFSNGPEAICLDNTKNIGELATTVLDILNRADGQSIKATAAADAGVALSTWSIPVALHYRVSVSGTSNSDVASGDLTYVNAFASTLSDDKLTQAELLSSIPLGFSDDGQTLTARQPEDALETEVKGGILVRQQIGLSMARSFVVAGVNVDIGLTPKFSALSAAGISTPLGEQFTDETDTLSKQLDDSETSENTFTFDAGASMQLTNLPLQLSIVARNLIEESITSQQGFVFDTTPQLIVGSAFSLGSVTLTGDLALNEAKVDSLDTQIVAIGVDYSRKYVGVRAGISHDNARAAKATALALGFSLGPLHIGGRITERLSAQAGAQLAFSF